MGEQEAEWALARMSDMRVQPTLEPPPPFPTHSRLLSAVPTRSHHA